MRWALWLGAMTFALMSIGGSGVAAAHVAAAPTVNLNHLTFLKDHIDTKDGALPIWWIYASPALDGRYHLVDAEGEGVACVDDVARAAIVYLKHYRQTGDPPSLSLAKDALHFILAMQRDDGLFYNFVYADGRINTSGVTSRPGINWWMARAMWAMAEAVATVADDDPLLVASLHEAYIRSFKALEAGVHSVHGLDVAGIFLMSLARYYDASLANERSDNEITWNESTWNESTGDNTIATRLLRVAERLGDLLVAYQVDDPAKPHRGMRPNDRNNVHLWHAWGNHGMEALAYAGRVFDRPDWIESSKLEADAFHVPIMKEYGSIAAWNQQGPEFYPQIAYGQATLVRGMVELFHATGERRYAVLAGAAGSWFYGSNPAKTPMYDPTTGRGYDGIDQPPFERPQVNWSSGAESTIEALWAILAINTVPEAWTYLGGTSWSLE